MKGDECTVTFVSGVQSHDSTILDMPSIHQRECILSGHYLFRPSTHTGNHHFVPCMEDSGFICLFVSFHLFWSFTLFPKFSPMSEIKEHFWEP